MKHNDEYAFAFAENEECYAQHGLTKREYFAGLAMQGILISASGRYGLTGEVIAEEALNCADALLNALEGKKQTFSAATPPNITEEEAYD